MSEQIKEFMQVDQDELAKSNKDFTFFTRSQLNKVMQACAADNSYDLDEKETESSNFGYFANCVKNNVFMNKTLNQNRTVRELVGGVHY